MKFGVQVYFVYTSMAKFKYCKQISQDLSKGHQSNKGSFGAFNIIPFLESLGDVVLGLVGISCY